MNNLRWDNLVGKTIYSRYKVKSVIGSGGAGKVYVAYDIIDGIKVAIKTSNPNQSMSNSKERFKKEANILNKLNHPNIIRFHRFLSSKANDIEMIVMEYVEGISLQEKLKKEKSLDESEVINYVKQILSALKCIHKHKVFHRDVKPENIHITIDGKVKLLDFGIIQDSVDQDLTKHGSIIGTVSYLAPELIEDTNKKASERTDIYSVGIMMYQLLTGVRPFIPSENLSGKDIHHDLAKKILHKTPVQPKKINGLISDSVNAFVMKLIERDPEDRYQSSQEAIDDLEAIERGDDPKDLEEWNISDKEINKETKVTKKLFYLGFSIIFLLLVMVSIIVYTVFFNGSKILS